MYKLLLNGTARCRVRKPYPRAVSAIGQTNLCAHENYSLVHTTTFEAAELDF